MEVLHLKQYLALSHLAAGATNLQAAEAVGVSESSVEKWKKRADFQKLIKEAPKVLHDAAIAELACVAIKAAQELRDIVNNPESADRVKISAIRTLFSELQNARVREFEARVERLEDLLDANKQN